MRKKLFFILPLLFILSSCCSNVSKQESKGEINKEGGISPQSVQINKSIVRIKVVKNNKPGAGYSLLGKVVSVKEDPFYPSIAVEGEQYQLKLDFALAENKEMDAENEKNKRLLLIPELKQGEEFNAVISYNEKDGWIINDYIGEE